MKLIARVILFVVVLFGCQKESRVEEGSSLMLAISMPHSPNTNAPVSRLLLSENMDGEITVRWREGDKINLCFSSLDGSTVKYLTGVEVVNISSDGREGKFEVEIPEGIEGNFNLYGFYGASFNSGNKELLVFPETESQSGDLSNIGDGFVMDFSSKNIAPNSGVVNLSFRYLGAIMAIHLTNSGTSTTTLSTLTIESDSYYWLENIPGGAQYNWKEGTFTDKKSGKSLSFISGSSLSLSKGEKIKLYRWIVPTTSYEASNRLGIKVDGTALQESIPAIEMERGRYYALNLVYHADVWSALPFGDTPAVKLADDTNCHLINPPVSAGGSAKYLMPISRVNQFWGYSTYGDALKVLDADAKWVADIIWKDVDLTDGVELISLTERGSRGVGPNSFVEFEVKYDAEERFGNALIGVRKADDNFNPIGDYLWSWHIWISDYSGKLYDLSEGEGLKIMDRNLGARSNIIGDPSTMGLLYQWGRKDPFVSGNYTYWLGGGSNTFISTTIEGTWSSKRIPYTVGGTVGWAVGHPTSFIRGEDDEGGSTYNGSNWLKSSSSTLWSHTEKTLFDPCPKGFKVANNGVNSSAYSAIKEENLRAYPTSSPHGRLYGTDLWFPTTGYLTGATGAINGVRTRCYLGSGGTSTSTNNDPVTGQKSHYVRTLSFTISDPITNYYANVRRSTAMGMRCIEWPEDI